MYGDEAVVRALKDFSMRLMLWWFEAMSLLRRIPVAAGLIQAAHRWAVCPFIAYCVFYFEFRATHYR
jgi:hypothetical protein